MHFTSALGSELVQAFRFQHFYKKPCSYSIKIERIGSSAPPDFHVDKPTTEAPPVTSWEGNELSIPIVFEPSSLGESRAILTVSHPEAGEYSCSIFGHSTPPMPQGPVKCMSGKGGAVEFRNPFFEPVEFQIKIDNPSFTVSAKSPVRLDPKKPMPIQVAYKPIEGKPNTGRMIISAGDLPPWVYYLSGE